MNLRIPPIFHFVFGLKRQWKPFHLLHYLCLESCWQVNRPQTIYFHHDHLPYGKYWDRIRDRLTLVKVERDDFVSEFAYKDKGIDRYRYAHHADFIRLRQLQQYGGVYADIDTLFVHPYPRHLFTHRFVLGREGDIRDEATGETRPSLCNALIMAEVGSDFGRLWLDRSREAFDGTWSNHSTVLPYRLSREHPDWIHVEPPRSFYRYMWTVADLETLFERDESDWEKVYSVHLWSHLWWARKRRDFSLVHAGRFTDQYIKNVDTTFNRVARQFL
jgi:hypothetical protein